MKKAFGLLVCLALVLALAAASADEVKAADVPAGDAAAASVCGCAAGTGGASAEGAAVWYPNNTLCVSGVPLREIDPALTNKWYHILPVDLTRDGVQTFSLIASNLYYMGELTVVTEGDSVTFRCDVFDGWGRYVYPGEECLAWFAAVDDITADFLKAPEGNLKFGETYSFSGDLGGNRKLLLFVCNRLTYRVPATDGGFVPERYWPNTDDQIEQRRGYYTMMKELGY